MLCAGLAGACSDNNGRADSATLDLARDIGGVDAKGDNANVADLFPAPVPDDCVTNVKAGQHSFQCEGMSVDVSVPDACLLAPCGLVADMHGGGGSGFYEDALTNLRALGRQHGYIVVQPTAPAADLSWQLTDDDAVFKIIQRVAQAWHVDLRRIHMTGFSSGGHVAWRFLCNHADVFASVAPACAGITCGSTTPTREIDALFLFGRKDPTFTLTLANATVDGVVASWGLGAPEVVSGDQTYTHKRYTNGQGTILETLDHDYVTDPNGPWPGSLGHCIPGGDPSVIGCQPPNAFAWGAEVIKFFMAHPQKL